MTSNTNSCEALQPAGAAVTTANSGGSAGRAWDNVTGTVTYDTTHTHTGAEALKVDMAGGTTSQVRWTDGADQSGGDSWMRAYLWFDAHPTVAASVLYITDHLGATLLRGRINTDGTVSLLDNTAMVIATTTTAIATGQQIRLEMHVTAGSTGELWLYNTADDVTATEHITASASTGGTNPGGWRIGGVTSTASTDVWWIDDIATSDTAKIGPKRVAGTWTQTPDGPDAEVRTYPTPGNWLLALYVCKTSDGTLPTLNVGDLSRNLWSLLTTETVEAHGEHAAAAMQVEIWACPAVAYEGWPFEAVYAQASLYSDIGSTCVSVVEVPMANGYLTVDSVTVASADAAASLAMTAPAPSGGANCLQVAAAAVDVSYGSFTATGADWSALPGIVSVTGPTVGLCSAWREATTSGSVTLGVTGSHNWTGVLASIRTTGTAPAQPNPHWPAVAFQVGLGYDLSTPMPRVHWTDQTSRFYSLASDGRGIQAERGLPQQSATDIVLDNRDAAYSPRPAGTATATAPGTTTTLLISDADAAGINVGDFFRLRNNTVTVDFSDDFESGTLAAWPTVIGNAASSASAALSGSYGLRIDPGGGVASQVATSTTKWAQNTYRAALLRWKMRWNSLPTTTSADGITFQNSPSRIDNLDVYYNQAAGTLWFDLAGATAYVDTGIVPEIGRVYDMQALVDYGTSTYTAQLMIDGAVWPVLESPGETPGYARSLHLGTSSTGKTYQFDLDDVSVTVSTAPLSFGEGEGGLKEFTVFQVTGMSSAAGTTTITFQRADGGGGAAAATQTGDQYEGVPVDLYTPYRQLGTIDGKTHVAASGWMRDNQTVYVDASTAYAQIVAADAWETLNADDPSILAGEILRRNPTHYWPLNDAAGAGSAANTSGVSAAQLTQTRSKYGAGASSTADFGASTQDIDLGFGDGETASILGDPGTGWGQDGLTSAEMDDKGYALVGQGISDLPPISGGITIAGVIITTSSQATTIESAGHDPTLMIARNADPGAGVGQGAIIKVSIDRATGQARVTWWDKDTHASTTTVCSNSALISGERLWALALNQTSWAMYVDGFLAGAGSCDLVATWTGLDIGGEADQFFHGRFIPGRHAHIAVFDRPLTQTESVDLYTASSTASLGEAAYGLIRRKLDVTGWPGGRVLLHDSVLMGPEESPSGSIADIIAEVAAYGDGLVFPDAASQLQYRSVIGAGRQSVRAVLGEDAAAGEIPYQPGVSPAYSPAYLYNAVSITNTRKPGNSRGGTATTTFVAIDETSASRYGQRGMSPATRFNLDGSAWDMAWWYLSRYASPAQRVETVTIEAAAAPERWAFVLSVEVGDLITVMKRHLGRPVISLRCRVLKVAPRIVYGSGGEVSGSVTLTLAAAPPEITILGDPAYGVAGDTVMGA